MNFSVNHLSKSFRETDLPVLKNVSLTVNEGEFVSVIGPSGCGKSTLLDCISGLTTPNKGEISFGETAYMFQDDVMMPWRSVLDNVIVPLELTGVQKEEARTEARKLLKEFGLEKFASYYPFQLSGGMKERAALVRTYLCKKSVLLLDEPFSKLDALTRQQMQLWFVQIIQKKKTSVLFVTHDVDEAIVLSDRIYILSKRPGTVIGEVPVKLKKQRNEEVILTKEFITTKKEILHLLKQNL